MWTGWPAAQSSFEPAGSSDWRQAWRDLTNLERTAPASVERRRLSADLEAFQASRDRSARKRKDRAEIFRARLLRVHLARVAEAPFRPVPDPDVAITWLPGEAWLAAQVLAPGATRVNAVEAALAEVPTGGGEACIRLAFEIAGDDARELHLDRAESLARSLRARLLAAASEDLPAGYRGGAQSVVLLARISRLRGDEAEARSLLETHLASKPEPLDRSRILTELALVRIAEGRDVEAQRDLGEAFVLGSRDAGWLLARTALSQGVFPRARALCRALIEEDSTPAPALRAYGISLLSDAAPTDPSAGNHPATPR
jgi:hypothetical protein